jgi:uncharacterized protein YxjI
MKFSINTEDFSSRFTVVDSEGLERYLVKNEMDSVMRKLTIYDLGKTYFYIFKIIIFFFKLIPLFVPLKKNSLHYVQPMLFSIININ